MIVKNKQYNKKVRNRNNLVHNVFNINSVTMNHWDNQT